MAAHRAGKPVSGLGGLSIAGGCVAPSAGSGVMSKGTLNSKLMLKFRAWVHPSHGLGCVTAGCGHAERRPPGMG